MKSRTRRDQLFEEMKSNASEKDVEKINKEIERMCKGALKDVWENVVAMVKMINDNKVAITSKAIAIGALVYTVSPIDAIPDIIPILGFTDDAVIITAAVGALGGALQKYKANKRNYSAYLCYKSDCVSCKMIEKIVICHNNCACFVTF